MSSIQTTGSPTGTPRVDDDPFANAALRRFDAGRIALESGRSIDGVVVGYQTWGTLNRDASNAILVEHALTGDAHVVGETGAGQPTAGWWPGVIGPGRPLDTDRYFVVASNVLGGCRGTTGPSSTAPDGRPWGSRFPQVSIRDQVRLEAALADHLGVPSWRLVLGGSMGGMRALEWLGSYPDRCEAVLAIATTACATADQIAWGQAQVLAITSDPGWAGGDYHPGEGPRAGLGIARRIAHTTYRSAQELQDRFGVDAQSSENPLDGGRFAVESYLDHQAGKLVNRFDAASYVHLTRAMATHDIGRGRGGAAAVIARYPGRLHVAAVDSDRLFPPHLSHDMAAAAGERVKLIRSASGHDGFLIETDQIEAIVRSALVEVEPRRVLQVG
ncbi:homoserine O-acetyltransferase MetX [Calidifontibacter indicus]|uniref:homoserine O-acetyltransferase MetX n=1 Tax=Calidifontibacter indicus TaxID=419650 RepID=UPI003D7151D1